MNKKSSESKETKTLVIPPVEKQIEETIPTKSTLTSSILKLIEEYEKTEIEPDETLKFLREFLKDKNIEDVSVVKDIDICCAFTAYILANYDAPLEPTRKAANSIRIIMTGLPYGASISCICSIMQRYLESMDGKDLNSESDIAFKEANSKIRAILIENKLDYIDPVSFHDLYIHLQEIPDYLNISGVITTKEEVYKIYGSYADAIAFCILLRQVKDMYKVLDDELKKQCGDLENLVNKKIPIRKRNSIVKNHSDFKKFQQFYNKVVSYKNKKEDDLKNKEKSKNRSIKDYKLLLKMIAEIDETKEITNLSSFLSRISDDKIRLEFLKYVYSVNQKIHQKLETEHQKLHATSNMEYRIIFADYGISVDDSYLDALTYSPKDLSISLQQLKQMKITSSDSLLAILLYSTKDAISTIASLYDRKILSQEELSNYPTIFIPTSKSFKNALLNIETLTSYEINPRYLGSSPKTLLADNKKLSENLETLQEKSYLDSIDRETNIDFMSKENLGEVLELINNLGYEETVKEDIDLLNIHLSRWKRLIILQSIGEESDIEDIRDILMNENFFVPDEKLDDYIAKLAPITKEEKTFDTQYVKTSTN